MGVYTEIFVNADLKRDTPKQVIEVLSAICNRDHNSKHLLGRPAGWAYMFCNGSYYTPSTQAASLTLDKISKQYSIIGKGDIENYNCEIQEFFEFIKPYCEEGFIGYHRYEEDREPTLVFSD